MIKKFESFDGDLSIKVIISRLKKIQRFDLCNYIMNEFVVETEREENDNGDYIDAYEIDVLIKDLTNGLSKSNAPMLSML